ncbi:MAG: DUF4214 domain-containing protein [Chloroflexi bacterium]|nr:DUF4214 domain-containing protein [Chloroflexota bacterium]
MIQNILGKIQRRLLARQSDFSQATEQDVYYCYRLLLNRQPDEAGWAYWSDLVNTHHISLQTLADGFLNSFELKTLLEERNRLHLVKLADFSMYVRLNDHFVGGNHRQGKELRTLRYRGIPPTAAARHDLFRRGGQHRLLHAAGSQTGAGKRPCLCV